MKRQISKLERSGKQKQVVFVNGERYGALYGGEIRRLHLEEGMEWTETLAAQVEELLYKRGKERALYLLQQRGYTTWELGRKLSQNGYSKEAINRIIAFLQQYGFLDDLEYARSYVRGHSTRYSKKQLRQKLMEKGIGREILTEVLEEDSYSETEALERAIGKRFRNRDLVTITKEERFKAIAYLAGRGFPYEKAKEGVDAYLRNSDET